MNPKAFPYLLLAVLLVITIVVLRFCRNDKADTGPSTSTGRRDSRQGDVNRNRGFDRRVSFLEYTKHARCRMECRQISISEVEDIMRNGNINYRKSNAKGHPCPTYAVEGYTNDEQHVRIVFAQCNEATKVVTCIDLEKEWQCDCPGDDDKYKNKGR